MSSLEARFDALQEELIELYESDEHTLEIQIRLWQLIRQEQACYYYARQKGINKIGLYPVPTLAVAETKAKQAIEMQLSLTSLKDSGFGRERWTIPEASYETYIAKPEKTFKKRPQQVTVVYDNNDANAMLYTCWGDIYYMNGDETWRKTYSDVDYEGIFYVTGDGQKVYYVLFTEDAEMYSESGQWQVRFANKVFSAPVSSTEPDLRTPRPPQEPYPGHNASASKTDTAAAESQQPTPAASRRRRLSERHRDRSRSRSRSRSNSRSHSSYSSRRPRASSRGGRGGRRRSGSRGSQQSESASDEEYRGDPEEAARAVGGRLATPSGAAHPRLAQRAIQLVKDANDPPVLLLQGCANTLKSFRRRCTLKHSDYFLCMSTCFTWVSSNDFTARVGQRMLVAFKDSSQRTKFLSFVKLPKTVNSVRGSLDSL